MAKVFKIGIDKLMSLCTDGHRLLPKYEAV